MGNPIFRFTLTHDKHTAINSVPSWDDFGNGSGTWGLNLSLERTITLGAFQTSAWLADDIVNPYNGVYNFLVSIDGSTNGAGGNTCQFSIKFLDSNQNIITSSSPVTVPNAGLTNYPVSLDSVQTPYYVMIQANNATGSSNTITVSNVTFLPDPESIQISEPDGWKDAELKLERHPDFHTLVEYFTGSFVFYGKSGNINGGLDFIKTVDSNYGPDANIQIYIEASFDEGASYEEVFDGLLDLSELQETKYNKLEVPIIRNDLWARFINRLETPVDLQSTTDLDGNPVSAVPTVSLLMTPQKLRQKYEGRHLGAGGVFAFPYTMVADGDYGILDFEETVLDEIKEKYDLPRIATDFIGNSLLFVTEYGGTYAFDVKITLALSDDPGDSTDSVDAYYDVKLVINGTEFVLTPTDILLTLVDEFCVPTGQFRTMTIFTYVGSLDLPASSEIQLYIERNGTPFGNLSRNPYLQGEQGGLGFCDFDPSDYGIESYLKIDADTSFPETEVEAYYLHDAFAGAVERIVGRNAFYSEILGRTDTNQRQYDSNGCLSEFVILKGLQVRGYTLAEKPAAFSVKHLWNGANPILNLCLGYEVIDGEEMIRLEDKAYAYNGSSTSVSLSNVLEVSRQYDTERIFKKINVGYNRWQSEDVSGIDDVQTKRVFATRFEKIGTELTLHSEFIAASLAIDVTRRQQIVKSKDYKYDNETFIIKIDSTALSPDRYTPELTGNFSSVTGLLNASTRYNTVISATRNLWRWLNYITGCLNKYTTSYIKFSSGEGNFDMTSNHITENCLSITSDSVSEKADISLTTYGNTSRTRFLHLPDLFEIETSLPWDYYQSIRDNREKAIRVSQTSTNHKRLLIKQLVYKLCKGKVNASLWPAEKFSLTVVENEQPSAIECPAPSIVSGGVSFDEDYQAILDYADSQGYDLPSDEQQELQNQLVLDLKDSEIWDDLDLLYVFATDGDDDFAKINWKNPGTFNCTEAGAGALIFTQNQGFTGDGTNYLNTGWDVANNAVNFTQNEGGFFVYSNAEKSNSTQVDVGARSASTTNNIRLLIENGIGNSAAGVHSTADSFGSPGTSIGLFHARRTASNDQRLFRDGVQQGSTATTASNGTPSSNDLFILADNSNGSPIDQSTAQIGLFGIGASLSGKEADLYTAWNTYFTSI